MSRLLSILALLALIVAPVAMLGGGTAMAGQMPQTAMSADHCSGMDGDQDKEQPMTSHNCVMTCSAIAPTMEAAAEKPISSGLAVHHALPLAAFHGIEPKIEIPPPRFA